MINVLINAWCSLCIVLEYVSNNHVNVTEIIKMFINVMQSFPLRNIFVRRCCY